MYTWITHTHTVRPGDAGDDPSGQLGGWHTCSACTPACCNLQNPTRSRSSNEGTCTRVISSSSPTPHQSLDVLTLFMYNLTIAGYGSTFTKTLSHWVLWSLHWLDNNCTQAHHVLDTHMDGEVFFHLRGLLRGCWWRLHWIFPMLHGNHFKFAATTVSGFRSKTSPLRNLATYIC